MFELKASPQVLDPDGERGRRVILGFLTGAAQVARMCRVPFGEVRNLIEMAQFTDARSEGMTLGQIAAAFGVSMRKVSQLASRSKTNFVDLHPGADLPRRIEFLLWAEPLSRARILQTLRLLDEQDVDAALGDLLDEGRIRTVRRNRTDVFERVDENSRLVTADDQARLEGLTHAISVLAAAVYGRFFRDEEKALYRTISFYMRAEDLPELREYYDQLWNKIQELEERAKLDPNTLKMEISLAYAPEGYLSEETRT